MELNQNNTVNASYATIRWESEALDVRLSVSLTTRQSSSFEAENTLE